MRKPSVTKSARISRNDIRSSRVNSDPIGKLRRMSTADLEQLGQDGLRDHLLAQAVLARQKHGPVTFDKLSALLNDPECVRHPTRLVFELGGMAMHQFAQPDVDWRNTAQDGRVLYLRPLLRDHPDLVVLAVAYMIPLINYGEIITDEHCRCYGTSLLGLMEAEFLTQICQLADFAGAQFLAMGGESSVVQG